MLSVCHPVAIACDVYHFSVGEMYGMSPLIVETHFSCKLGSRWIILLLKQFTLVQLYIPIVNAHV